jgi:quinone-modifying oxidoreductase subunit QmoC
MKSTGNLVGDIIASVTEILGHSKFADCTVNKGRQLGHLLLFYSFAGLAVVTTWAIIYLYGWELLGIQPFGPFHFGESPYPMSDPVKILALASSIAFALRLGDMELGYFIYFLHLVFVWSLFAYAPYSKFAHLFYRTTAMVFVRHSGRDKK